MSMAGSSMRSSITASKRKPPAKKASPSRRACRLRKAWMRPRTVSGGWVSKYQGAWHPARWSSKEGPAPKSGACPVAEVARFRRGADRSGVRDPQEDGKDDPVDAIDLLKQQHRDVEDLFRGIRRSAGASRIALV